MLELALEGAPGEFELGAQAGAARLPRELERLSASVRLRDRDVEIGQAMRGGQLTGGEEHSLDAGGPAAGRGRRTIELLDQAVVASAAADGRLRPELRALELVYGPRVVVEAAHERRVELVRNPRFVEPRAHGGEVFEIVL